MATEIEAGLPTLEGPWEEILAHSSEFTGKRVRVTVLGQDGEPSNNTERDPSRLSPRNQLMLRALEDYLAAPLSEEEARILDEFPEHRKDHPFALDHPAPDA